jgi:hypothetical protein
VVNEPKSSGGQIQRTLEAVGVFAALAVVTWWMFGDVLNLRPLGGDNLYVLSWANRAPATELLRVDPVIYPEWRPLPYATIWLQFQWSRLDHVALYHAVNLSVWVACAWFIWAIVGRITGSRVASFVAAALVVTDVRALTAQTLIVERQSSMAALFGLAAIWILARSWGSTLSKLTWSAIALLCLASVFSKEYGLAFGAAILVFGVWQRRRDLLTAGAAACAVYAIARWSIPAGATQLYCEYMGYFGSVRKVCYNGLDATGLSQMTYNVVATGVGTLLPGLLTADGQVAIAPMRLAVSAAWLALAWVGWRQGTWVGRVAGLVIAGNTALNFMIYTSRNQLLGVCAFGLVVGIGVAAVDTWLRSRSHRLPQLALAGLTAIVIFTQAGLTRRETGEQVANLLTQDPCIEILHTDQHDPALMREIKIKYGMSDPGCVVRRQP